MLPLIARVLALTAALAGSLDATDKPNILFLLADDLGQRDLGSYGSTFYETPNLDQLARDGIRFTNAYAACPVCSPTRAALLTGQYPTRAGITDYIGAAQPANWKRNTKLLPASYKNRLPHETTTLAEMCKGAGYATFFAGKWHLGPQGWWPEDHGFDVNIGGIDRGGPYGGDKYFSPYGNPRLPDGPPGEHLPDRLARETARFIEANKERPFLAYLSFYSVHTPLIAREDLRRKYEEKRKRLGLEPKFGREGERNVRMVQEHAVYAAMIEAMDLAVGKVLAALDANGLRKKTIVIFTSDNGGLSTSEGSPTSNLPLRAGKGWLYEGGIRVPLIVRWEDVVRAGSISDAPLSSPDFFPTLAELIGANAPVRQKIDGLSFTRLLREGTALPERPLFWHYPHYGNQGSAPGSAVRCGEWKLIDWYEEERRELFNLREDPEERRDRATEMPEKVKELMGELDAWRKETGALAPTSNDAYDPQKRSGRAANQRSS